MCNFVDKYLLTELYRVVYNTLTHFTKSVHLNCAKDLKCDLRIERETLQVFLYVPRAPSFVGGRQGRRLSENGGDGRIERGLRAGIRTNTVDFGFARKFSDQVR
jgi:hypothetical protein